MSGSSLDGLDMALCRFEENNGALHWKLLEAQTVSFPSPVYNALKSSPSFSGFELMKLDAGFGTFIGKEISSWVNRLSLQADLIASHGHTVFHEPLHHFTTQIGSGAHIAQATGIDTITTFRSADIAAGGVGAPFAPVADEALFPDYRACLNLGGIVNISLVTPDGSRKAWDIGPCNQALNYLANKSGRPYDENGNLAAGGKIIQPVVDALIAFYPFNNGQPRGLSNAAVQSSWIQYLDTSGEEVINLLASVTEAIAVMVCNHIRPFAGNESTVFVTGGGAHNRYLMSRLDAHITQNMVTFHVPSADLINYKECLLMAYLGYLTMHNKPYGIHRMTGASKDTIGGAFFKACR